MDSYIYSWIAFLALEVLGLIVGWSLIMDSLNFLQVTLHLLGCAFTAWFLLDSWQYERLVALWAIFGLLPFLTEVTILYSSTKFSWDTRRNLYQSKFIQ